jgi:hypothetical protein
MYFSFKGKSKIGKGTMSRLVHLPVTVYEITESYINVQLGILILVSERTTVILVKSLLLFTVLNLVSRVDSEHIVVLQVSLFLNNKCSE